MFALQHERLFLTTLNLATILWNIHVTLENDMKYSDETWIYFWTIKNVPILDGAKKNTVCKYTFYHIL